ncbi:hypothetical protein SH580_01105 [Coraliomargarita algicola]|uniref:Uncharacterized protein n=1 Tax=Coraliomargarita algicola TaxID=3092156 RepID=A0ABZ0RJB4_9BACT|nr:hypothetical protein [Coraliomargarita sp. J2-16]WPJ96299.1 hypothetical protein SH580_01105 [Coraliomargarita sp. J2-16]
MAPIYDESGRVHIFNSVIPNDGTWVEDSKIVHWVADQAEGPYTLLGDVFASDEAGYHNPQVSKVGDTYVLAFLLNRHRAIFDGAMDRKSAQSHLNANESNGQHASNPTFVATPDGSFRIYYKTMTKAAKKGQVLWEISMASSAKIEGPYAVYEQNPVLSYADHGIDWGIPKVGYQTNELYYGHELARSERPGILWKDGEPEYLFLACHDEDATAGYILKIDGWAGE